MWLRGRSVPARGLKVVIQINVVITVSSGESNCDCVPVLLSTVRTVIKEKSWHGYNLSRQFRKKKTKKKKKQGPLLLCHSRGAKAQIHFKGAKDTIIPVAVWTCYVQELIEILEGRKGHL